MQDCSKKFCKTLRRSLLYGLGDMGRECVGLAKKGHLRREEFWALRDVSLQLRRGECLGVIGPNGAGKSTLLKLIAGLVKPDAGRVEVRGAVGALIELSAGLNPILTGRENIYILGAIRGFTRKQIDSIFDQIAEFSELTDFMDTPVRSYSSGMRTRLGFSVAAQLCPDLLLIDEVMAVGDMNFRSKCINRTREMMDSAAVIFVSHNMAHIERLATKVLVLEQGHASQYDRVDDGIDYYLRNVADPPVSRKTSTDMGLIHDFQLCHDPQPDTGGRLLPAIDSGGRLQAYMDYSVCPTRNHDILLQFIDSFNTTRALVSTRIDGGELPRLADRQRVHIDVPILGLPAGGYTVSASLWIDDYSKVVARLENAAPHRIVGTRVGGTICRFPAKWRVEADG